MNSKIPRLKSNYSKSQQPTQSLTTQVPVASTSSSHVSAGSHSSAKEFRFLERQYRILQASQNIEGTDLSDIENPPPSPETTRPGLFKRMREGIRDSAIFNRNKTKSVVSMGGSFVDMSRLSAIELSQQRYERSMKPIKRQLGSIQGYVGDQKMTHIRPPVPLESKDRIYYQSGPLGAMFYRLNAERDMEYTIERAWWKTSRMVSYVSQNRELKIITAWAGLTMHLILVLFITLVGYWSLTRSAGILNTSLEGAFIQTPFFSPSQKKITFNDIKTHEEVFLYLQNIFIKRLLIDYWTIGDQNVIQINDNDKGLLFENKIIDKIYLQMIHVQKNTCQVHPLFKEVQNQCYDYYSREREMRSEFLGYYAGQVWTWARDDVNMPWFSGQFGTYHAGGYTRLIEMDLNTAQNQIQDLKHDLWIKRSTRLILARTTVYNANVNYFAHITIAFEIPPTGGVFPSYSFKIARLLHYSTKADYTMFAVQCAIIVLIILATLEAFREFIFFGVKYFSFFWSWIDLIIIGLCFHCIFLQLIIANKLRNTVLKNMIGQPFLLLIEKQQNFDTSLACAIFFCWIKIIKYLEFNNTIANMSETISQNMTNIISFFYFAMMMWFGFALLGYSWFGRQLPKFQTFPTTCMTLTRALFGEADFTRMIEVHNVLGPLYISLYYLVTVYNTMYLLLIVWMSSFEMNYGLLNFHQVSCTNILLRGFYRICVCFRPEVFENVTSTKTITFKEILGVLKKYDFHNEEILMFLQNYKIYPNREYSPNDLRKMVDALTEYEFIPRDESKSNEVYVMALRERLLEAKQLHDDVRLLKPKLTKTLGPVFEDVENLINRLYTIEAIIERCTLFISLFLSEMETVLFQMVDREEQDDDESEEYEFN